MEERHMNGDGLLPWFKVFRGQLISYRSFKKTPEDRDHLEADILGYELVIESKSESNARIFMELKRGPMRMKLPTNLKIVEYMKETGQWEAP